MRPALGPQMGGLVLRTVLLALCAGLLPQRGHADIGVALDTGAIAVTQRLSKGGTYQLPVVGVRNPGSEASVYTMGVGHFQGQPGRRPPPEWFTFSPSRFTLAPGASQPVRVTLDIPVNARPDDYAALLHAQIAPDGVGGQVGAAAASQLTFTVKPSTYLEAWFVRARAEMDKRSPWSYRLPLVLVGAGGLWWLGRRFRFRIERRARDG